MGDLWSAMVNVGQGGYVREYNGLKCTDGVWYFAEHGHAEWFIDKVATEILPMLGADLPMMGVCLSVVLGTKSTVEAHTNDGECVYHKQFASIGTPNGEWKFWLQDNTLSLYSGA